MVFFMAIPDVFPARPSTETSKVDRRKTIRLGNALMLTDFSPSSELALPYAVALAHQYDGKVVVAHVISPEMYEYAPPELASEIRSKIEEYGNYRMHVLLSRAEFHNVPHEAVVQTGEVWQSLKELAETLEIDVIVVGTHGRRGLTKALMGAVAQEIVQSARIPVLSVGPHCGGEAPRHYPTRILCATDFSADSVRAMAHAISLAQTFSASLVLTYVAPHISDDPSSKTHCEAYFEERLQELVAGEASSLPRLDYRVEFGTACDGILGAATNEKADFIVMGVRGAGSLHRPAHRMGTTSDEVVSGACCPVLTVRRLG